METLGRLKSYVTLQLHLQRIRGGAGHCSNIHHPLCTRDRRNDVW